MSQLFGGWFNNLIGIIQYFQRSHYFSGDGRMKAADGYVLWAIAEGYRGYLNIGSTSDNKWAKFMQAARSGRASDSHLRTLWAQAERDGVHFATDLTNLEGYVETPDQAEMYDLFLYFGDEYRTNVLQNDPAKIFGLFVGDDPRKDQGTVRYAASALESVYRYLIP